MAIANMILLSLVYNITIDEEVDLYESMSAPIESLHSSGRHGWHYFKSVAGWPPLTAVRAVLLLRVAVDRLCIPKQLRTIGGQYPLPYSQRTCALFSIR
jgi:hypothetical protein